ncbi:MAG: HD domain-containing protein [Eubacteriales bacterium]|nr:HD domain-containing protein [Eubacteriales bacterium]MDD4390089.1 HD domain-containing protein [Eubacteriales bacterium]
MNRVELIRKNSEFTECMDQINKFEKQRIYCGHDLPHFLDVARIAYIFNLEEDGQIPKELIYAAALLHDVGRAEQYKSDIAHDKAGVEIAQRILHNCEFTNDEIFIIVKAVRGHRGCAGGDKKIGRPEENDILHSKALLLAKYIRKADKLSRPCYTCDAANSCNWQDDKKNLEIIV